jgi:hypothetical protein
MTPSRADLSLTPDAFAPRTPHDGNASAMAKKKKRTSTTTTTKKKEKLPFG